MYKQKRTERSTLGSTVSPRNASSAIRPPVHRPNPNQEAWKPQNIAVSDTAGIKMYTSAVTQKVNSVFTFPMQVRDEHRFADLIRATGDEFAQKVCELYPGFDNRYWDSLYIEKYLINISIQSPILKVSEGVKAQIVYSTSAQRYVAVASFRCPFVNGLAKTADPALFDPTGVADIPKAKRISGGITISKYNQVFAISFVAQPDASCHITHNQLWAIADSGTNKQCAVETLWRSCTIPGCPYKHIECWPQCPDGYSQLYSLLLKHEPKVIYQFVMPVLGTPSQVGNLVAPTIKLDLVRLANYQFPMLPPESASRSSHIDLNSFESITNTIKLPVSTPVPAPVIAPVVQAPTTAPNVALAAPTSAIPKSAGWATPKSVAAKTPSTPHQVPVPSPPVRPTTTIPTQIGSVVQNEPNHALYLREATAYGPWAMFARPGSNLISHYRHAHESAVDPFIARLAKNRQSLFRLNRRLAQTRFDPPESSGMDSGIETDAAPGSDNDSSAE